MYTAELSTGDMSLLVYLTLPQVFSWQQVVIQSPALTTLKASSFQVYSWAINSILCTIFHHLQQDEISHLLQGDTAYYS